MKKYYRFDIEAFIRDYYSSSARIKIIQKQIEDIPLLPQSKSDDVRVQSSGGGEILTNIVDERLKLQAKIKEIESDNFIFENAFATLSEEEQACIDKHFTKPPGEATYILESEYGLSRTNVYKIKKKALEKLSKIIEKSVL